MEGWMTTLNVERMGNDLVIRLTAEAQATLALREGDVVVLNRTANGDVSLAPSDVDHQLRLERGRAFLRRYRNPT
jgi:antitoxin component of MazEF toxin-antitoxin module